MSTTKALRHYRTIRPMSEINNWVVLRRLTSAPGDAATKAPRYMARCPTCHGQKEVPLSFIENSPACAQCTESIRILFSRITLEDKKKIEARYLEHLRVCRTMDVRPSTLVSFLSDYTAFPALLDEESIVFADEPSSASPLTWGNLPDLR